MTYNLIMETSCCTTVLLQGFALAAFKYETGLNGDGKDIFNVIPTTLSCDIIDMQTT